MPARSKSELSIHDDVLLVKIIAIGKREEMQVYETAAERI